MATLIQDFEEREARAEKITCLVWLLVIMGTYALFMLGYRASVSDQLVVRITVLVLVMAPAFALIALMISRGHYSASMKYVNTFLQVTLVSGAILFDGLSQGPAYALSSMPPMAYALVPMITAFRLQPLLGLFAGAVAGAEFLLLYLIFLRPSPELIEAIPSLGLPVTMMKVIVLVALGVASAFAARSLNNYFINFGKAQEVRIRLERNFGRFVSREIVNRIRESEDGCIPPSSHEAAIVFGDIRNFTHFSARTEPQQVSRILNEFFEIVCRVIEEEGGMVNKFLGDGYLALFGIYSADNNPAESAARAVLRIETETASLLEPLGLSAAAAANYGRVIASEIGSRGRCEFSAIGPPVNLASRLEGLNVQLGTSFLVTRDFADKLTAGDFWINDHGRHSFKGLESSVDVLEVKSRPLAGNRTTHE